MSGRSSGPSLALQCQHGFPGAPHSHPPRMPHGRNSCASQSHRAPRQIGQSGRLRLGEFDIELPVEQQRQFKLRGDLLRRALLNQQFRRALPRLVAGPRLELAKHITLGLVSRSKRLAGFVFDGAGQASWGSALPQQQYHRDNVERGQGQEQSNADLDALAHATAQCFFGVPGSTSPRPISQSAGALSLFQISAPLQIVRQQLFN